MLLFINQLKCKGVFYIFFFSLFTLPTHNVFAQGGNDKSGQWQSRGGELLMSGNQEFNDSWTSTSESRQKGLYWQGGFYDKEEDRNYQPWENTVKNSVAPVLGKFTVVGPGTIGLYQRTKGARIILTDVETKASFITWNGGNISWNRDSWQGAVNEYPTSGFPFWGQVGAGQEITLEVSANMTPYNNAINTGEYAFRAPQEVTDYEIWFFPREDGKVISVTNSNEQPPTGNNPPGISSSSPPNSIPGYDHVSVGEIYDEKDNRTVKKGERVYFDHRLHNKSGKTVWITLSGVDDSKRTKIAIKPNSIIVIKHKVHKTNKSGVMLVLGRLWTLFKGPKKGFAVETYNSVSGVEGTAFETAYDPNSGKTTVTVYEGKVNFSCKEGNASPLILTKGLTASFDGNCIPSLGPTYPTVNTPQKAGWEIPTVSSTAASGRLSPIADSHVYAYSYRNWNKASWGKYKVLSAGWNPIGGEKRAYLKFDVSGIDKSSFEKATLRLYHYHSAGSDRAELGVFTVRNPWNEGSGDQKPQKLAGPNEICWENQPFSDQYPVAYFNPGMQTGDFVEVDITPLVKSWLEGMPNHGLAIKAGENYVSGSESMYGFHAREHEDIETRPQLIINGGTSINTVKSSNSEFFEDFSDGLNNLKIDDPNAYVTDGKMFWSSGSSGRATFKWEIPIENVAIEFDGYTENNGFGIHWLNKQNVGYSVTFGGWFNTRSGSHFGAEGQNLELVDGKVFELKKWHHYKIVRSNNELSGYCDDELVFTRTINQTFEGPAELWFSSWAAKQGFDNVRVYKIK